MATYTQNMFLSTLYLTLGFACTIYGVSYFMFPLTLIIIGLALIIYGLRLRGVNLLTIITHYWLSRRRW